MLRKFVLASLIAVSAGAAVMPAQAEKEKSPGPGQHRKWDPAKMAEMRTKHLEALHKKLDIKPEQESAWQTWTEQTKMPERPQHSKADWEAMQKLSAPERMEKMLEHMKAGQTRMEQHLAALKTFYGQLTPEQKATFDKVSLRHRPGGPGQHHHGHDHKAGEQKNQ